MRKLRVLRPARCRAGLGCTLRLESQWDSIFKAKESDDYIYVTVRDPGTMLCAQPCDQLPLSPSAIMLPAWKTCSLTSVYVNILACGKGTALGTTKIAHNLSTSGYLDNVFSRGATRPGFSVIVHAWDTTASTPVSEAVSMTGNDIVSFLLMR